nr:competence type IV pilus minor pilin ComGD [Planococcus sp. ISL-109]
MKQQGGFTLIEMLLVLSVLGVVSSLALSSAVLHEERREEQRFFALLEQDIHYAQSQSYALSSSVMLVFREGKLGYEVMYGLNRPGFSRPMPSTVSLSKTSNIREVYFTPSGSIRQPGTLRFATSRGERTVTIHLGKGRVVVSQ